MPEPFQPEDLLLYNSVSEIDCNPHTGTAACVVESMLTEQDSRQGKVWLVPADGSGARQFTYGSGTEDMPRWSPDGSQLAFLSTRSNGLRQIFVMPANGGEAKQISRFTNGANSIEWSPDGKKLLATC